MDRRWAIAALTCIAAACRAGADEPARPVAVRVLSPSTVVALDGTRIVAFGLAEPASADGTLEATSQDANIVEVLGPAQLSAGQSIGTVRVRGVGEGVTQLRIGEHAVEIKVERRAGHFATARRAPEIVSPVNGAVVWGGVTVGIEWFEDPRLPVSDVRLMVNGSTAVEPDGVSNPKEGPTRRAWFTLKPETVGTGLLEFTAVMRSHRGELIASRPTRVRAIEPGSALEGHEAEAWADAVRPDRFARGRVGVVKEQFASGGAYVNNAGSDPAVGVILDVPTAGLYQVMIVAAGDAGGTALPTVGLVIDGANNPVTHGRLAGPAWHRLPVGGPVRVEEGWRTLSVRFENDFSARGTDRNLRIDRIELVRLDKVAGGVPVAAAGGGGEGMMGGGMMASAPGSGAPQPMGEGSMMGGAMAAGSGETTADDPDGRGYSPVRVAWAGPYDGRIVSGVTQLDGVLNWANRERAQPATVCLMLNGKVFSTQVTTAPRFWVSPSDLRAGDNTVQLVARSGAGTAASPVQVIRWEGRSPPATAGGASDGAGTFERITLYDPAMGKEFRDGARPNNESREARRAGLAPEEKVTIDLAAGMSGKYAVWMEHRCTQDTAKAKVTVTLRAGGAEVATLTRQSQGWWETNAAGVLDLPAGPKQLVVAYANEAVRNPKPENKGLWLESVMLRAAPRGELHASSPPTVELAWPPRGDALIAFDADAVVFTPQSAGTVSFAEVLIDGNSTGVGYDITRQAGPFCLPVPLRGLTGEHTVAVRVRDAAGNSVDSPARAIRVLDGAPAGPTRYGRAVRLLNRFGYGPEPRELAALLVMGEEAWLGDRLARGADDGADAAALGLALARFGNPRNEGDVTQRALTQALVSGNPARTRFVFWAQNHFSTWIRKPEADRKWAEHIDFYKAGAAPWADLVMLSATSPAMLAYLDQTRSFAGRLNENYAREILELHTLGVNGGYSQEDVTSLARLLTGWSAMTVGDGFAAAEREVRRMEWRFDPVLNDGKAVTVLGRRFAEAKPEERYDRVVEGIETIVAHPATARQVCLELCEAYVAKPAPEDLVEDLAAVFRETYGDMRAVLCAMAAHPAFWRESATPRLAHPMEWAVRMLRCTGETGNYAGQVNGFLRRARAGLFDCSTPDGYSDADNVWIDSNAMLQRWKLCRESQYALAGVVPPGWRWSTPKADGWEQAVVDVIAVRLTGGLLREGTNRQAVELLKATEGSQDERVREVSVFIAQSPDANVR